MASHMEKIRPCYPLHARLLNSPFFPCLNGVNDHRNIALSHAPHTFELFQLNRIFLMRHSRRTFLFFSERFTHKRSAASCIEPYIGRDLINNQNESAKCLCHRRVKNPRHYLSSTIEWL